MAPPFSVAARLLPALALLTAVPVFVASTARGAAPGCSATGVETTVRAFASTFNSGSGTRAAALFARAPSFKWYASGAPGARLGSKARNRASLAAYLAARVRKHERLGIVSIAAGFDSRAGDFNFGGKLIRRADDINRATRRQDFKGAAVCVAGRPRLIVWSM
jgi:hypothetical protein